MAQSDYQEPHRGVLLLVLGILSLVICQLIGPVAWIMGKGDLEKIDAGRMDPEGRGLTQAGMIIGIVSTVLMILGLCWVIFVMVFAGGVAMTSGA